MVDRTPRTSTPPSIQVLVVDDDERWARATARLLEHDSPIDVEVAHSLAAGRERFLASKPDCVVCDYRLGDGTGLALVETVRDTDPDLPFVLVTGAGDEAVASEAISVGVTDYIRKGIDTTGDELVSTVRELVERYHSRRALEREKRTKTAVLDVLRETTSEADLCQEFCDQLVATNAYALAWIGRPAGARGLVPTAAAGRTGYLSDVTGDDRLPADEPGQRAAFQGESVVVSISDDSGDESASPDSWRAAAVDADFTSILATPISHTSVSFGVLVVSLADETPPSAEVHVVEEYAAAIAYALQSHERKQTLFANRTVDIEARVSDRAAPLVDLVGRLTPTVEADCLSVVPRRDGSTVYVADVSGASAAAVERAVAETPGLSLLDTADRSAGRYRLHTERPTPEGVLADHGAQFRLTTVTAAAATVLASVSRDTPISPVAQALDKGFSGASVSPVYHQRLSAPPAAPLSGLTDKQRTVLRHAFYEGYFERPREANATEIAGRLGISRQTFAQHLRTAQRRLLSCWWDPDDGLAVAKTQTADSAASTTGSDASSRTEDSASTSERSDSRR